ncbi:hypothetical protein VitviT2T_000331 [Vitis vinifera]|uniref:AB hydrolase-1 domain-containing protein n=3 Tax=Vitis vinifera TaxID=29760 RepID=A0ABY9BC97_VITVI|nr:uncharacterized protein LOC100247521 isoform X1 [Vitis vinifera]WJZ80408.1 hypothetical protein VitviT2T_000331 [Vitis vinifera]|eukprot:XP_010664543.1 PREDICTED: uncharacterized protein LOC100247521 isoform X1 [Vitis vinifera]
MVGLQSDMPSTIASRAASTFRNLNPAVFSARTMAPLTFSRTLWPSTTTSPVRLITRAFSTGAGDVVEKIQEKPSICTADELHYVSVSNSDWRLALWRYSPSPQAPPRNHPLLLLSGVGTNAIGFDLSPGSSFARYMAGQGFDTWILEFRGAGLSMQGLNSKQIKQSANAISQQIKAAASATNGSFSAGQQSNISTGAELSMLGLNSKEFEQSTNVLSDQMEAAAKSAQQSNIVPGALEESKISAVKEDTMRIATVWDESKLVMKLTETFMLLSERLSGFLSEGQLKIMSAKLFDQISKLIEDSQLSERFNEVRGNLSRLLETRQNSGITSQIRDLSQRLVNIIEEGQRSVSPQLFDLQERFSSTIEDFQKQLDLIVKYDWDFDQYLEEDVPAAMEYIMAQTKPKDGKLLAIGHSMGGILLYARLSKYGFEGRDPRLAAIVTLASSLDYTSSNSSLKMLLPLADPAQALNVPVVPLGALLAAAYPLSSGPPYVLSWLNYLISAEDMMHPKLLKKLVLNNFCTIPAKLLLQLTTAFREGGLCDRSGKFFYKDHLHKTNVPVLALAGDQDLICPPEAVYETAKLIPEHLVTYRVFGAPEGPHYAHYDLVGGRLAVEQVYPSIIEFLSSNDSA